MTLDGLTATEQIKWANSVDTLIAVEGAVFMHQLWMRWESISVILQVPKEGYIYPHPNQWQDFGEALGVFIINTAMSGNWFQNGMNLCGAIAFALKEVKNADFAGRVMDIEKLHPSTKLCM